MSLQISVIQGVTRWMCRAGRMRDGLAQYRYLSCQKAEPQCGQVKGDPCAKPKQPSAPEKKKILPTPLPPDQQEITLKIPDECCADPCKDSLPRFDLLYYKRSDKLKRQYQQTWAECPELMKKPKVICCFDKIKYPQLPKRARKDRPRTACQPVDCLSTGAKCPTFTLAGCRAARRPPKCSMNPSPKLCKKIKAPYPSFSECSRNLAPPLRPIECKCLNLVSMCEVWDYYRRQQLVKKVAKIC